jgi:hypothetical protein
VRSLLTKGWVLFMLVVMGLGLAGVGYALWSQQLQLEGVVVTDSMEMDYVKQCTDDNERVDCQFVDPLADPLDDGNDPEGPGPEPLRIDKDIAFCTCSIDEVATNNKIQIHMTDTYPSYWCTTWFSVRNNGTIPVMLDKVILNGTEIEVGPLSELDADQDGDNDMEVAVSDLVLCEQQDPDGWCAESGCYDDTGNVEVHILNGADEAETISFELELIYVNWNECTANCPCP